MEVSQNRQVAKKVRLIDIKNGIYVRVEGKWDPNFIQTTDGRKFSRVNVIAIIASEPVPEMNFNTFIIDDGSARLTIRVFDDLKFDVKLGDAVLIIGRPREYNQQIFIVPEIIKIIENQKWIEYRKLELDNYSPIENVIIKENPIEEKNKNPPIEDEIVEIQKDEITKEEDEIIVDDNEESSDVSKSPVEIIINTIKKLDEGAGAEVEEVISISNVSNAEKIIDNLLKEGEIFEITSGMIKVLE